MNTGSVGWRLVKKLDGAGKGEVGIVAANKREEGLAGITRNSGVEVHKDGRGARRFEKWRIALVGKECDLPVISMSSPEKGASRRQSSFAARSDSFMERSLKWKMEHSMSGSGR